MNRQTTRTLNGGALVLVLMTWVSTSAWARDFRHTYQVDPGGELRVETDLGSIAVETGAAAQVAVEVTASGHNAEDFAVEFTESDGDPVILGHFSRSLSGQGSRNAPRVRFEITVPEDFDVNLDTRGGSISVANLNGQVQARTSGGSLRFGNIEGSVEAKTAGGSISLEGSAGDAVLVTSGGSIKVGDVTGDVHVKTSGGSITLGRIRGEVAALTSGGSIRVEEVAGTVEAKTSGGSVTAYISEQPAGDCRLSTSGGSVTVQLAADIAIDLNAKSSGGRAQSEFNLEDEVKNRNSLTGRLNGGGPELYLRSVGGGVLIARR